MITSATSEQLQEALNLTNKKYKGNIRFKRLDAKGRRWNFTLTVNKSKEIGGRIGSNGRRIAAACYHAHFDFMANLFKINPVAKIKSCQATYDGLTDFHQKAPGVAETNISSMFSPLVMGDACDCH